jgi:glycine/D-amino acid oxidase-like deaminating enzyme
VSVAVVGAGIVGLATGFALLERGADVTVYERGTPGAAQSGGESRIFRHAHDDPRLVALAIESRAAWRDWERQFGVELVSGDGAVQIGPVARRVALLRDAGVRVREVDGHPLLAGADAPAMLDEDGGVIRTRAAVAALVAALGDRLVTDEVVALGAGGEVRATAGARRFDRVVVCAGRETAWLAGDLALPVRISTHVRLTYRVRGAPPASLPCLQDGRHGAYGDPLPGNDRFAVGLGDVPAETTAYVAEHLPGLVPEPVEERHCWVTELPWGHDGIGVWETGDAVFVAGNNLFKHAPALGRALAAAALGEAARHDLSPNGRIGSAT